MGEINKMGQRFQIIVKTPAEKYSVGDNPNDKLGSVYIYHCQWMWGNYAVWRNGNLIKGIKELLKETRKNNKKHDFTGIDYQGIIDQTIKWVCYKDLHSQNRISPYDGNESYLFEKNETWLELINTFDNNNGVLLIEITEDDKINYAFINPYDNEGSNYEKLLDYKTYLKDYEDDKQVKKHFEKDKEYKECVKQFEGSTLLTKFPTINDWMRKKE